MLKLLVTSDLHGRLPDIKESFDLLLICGDICPPHDHYFNYQKEWFEKEFVAWINTLPFGDVRSKVIMTWGNHDFLGERYRDRDIKEIEKLTNGRVIILKNQHYDYEYITDEGVKEISFFGTPYCKIFGNWAFMVNNNKLKEKYSLCPRGVDIVITHDSPKMNGLGVINEGYNTGVDAGNLELDNLILVKQPKYVFSGHIHSGNHNFEKLGKTYMANVSYINERYNPTYPILSFTLGDNKEATDIKYIDTSTKIIY